MQVFPTRFTESLKPIKWLVLERSRLSKPRPDITGDLVFSRLRGEDTLECYGAFSSVSGVSGLYKLEFAENDQSLPSAKASFKASRSNAILGKSQTLQTNALRLMAIIKS